MYEILIAAEQEAYRLFLRTVLESYAHNEYKKFSIREAANGAEAIMLASLEHYDLIFINVKIPIINGIEAAKLIRENDSKVMIIAVSEFNTLDNKEILHSGAEDYITKSISAETLTIRLNTYFSLINSRKHSLSIRKGHNLFTHNVYAKTVSFFVKDSDVLAEFWEYYFSNAQKECLSLSNVIRMVYDIGALSLELNSQSHIYIYIEESDENIYFTIDGLFKINPDLILATIFRNGQIKDYAYIKDTISILYPKNKEHSTSKNIANITPMILQKQQTEDTSLNNSVFCYMDEENLENIEEYLSKLNSLFLIVGGGDITLNEVEEIAYYLNGIGRNSSIYHESYAISRSLSRLSSVIEQNTE
ncbi:MAG: response regulator, partial [Sulfurimonas sp.]|nr:response regulator [Sulfurimonas sp.]